MYFIDKMGWGSLGIFLEKGTVGKMDCNMRTVQKILLEINCKDLCRKVDDVV